MHGVHDTPPVTLFGTPRFTGLVYSCIRPIFVRSLVFLFVLDPSPVSSLLSSTLAIGHRTTLPSLWPCARRCALVYNVLTAFNFDTGLLLPSSLRGLSVARTTSLIFLHFPSLFCSLFLVTYVVSIDWDPSHKYLTARFRQREENRGPYILSIFACFSSLVRLISDSTRRRSTLRPHIVCSPSLAIISSSHTSSRPITVIKHTCQRTSDLTSRPPPLTSSIVRPRFSRTQLWIYISFLPFCYSNSHVDLPSTLQHGEQVDEAPYGHGQVRLWSDSFPGVFPEGEGYAMRWAAGLETGVY